MLDDASEVMVQGAGFEPEEDILVTLKHIVECGVDCFNNVHLDHFNHYSIASFRPIVPADAKGRSRRPQ